jgi:hypothetical protein
MTSIPNTASTDVSLRPLRCALTGGGVLLAQFVLCWLAVFAIGAGPSHMFIQIFTAQAPSSMSALAEGGFWSVAFGALSGVLVAFFYNTFRFLQR